MLSFNEMLIFLLPLLSITFTGALFPITPNAYRPVFQPPDWVFSIVWSYITLSLGYSVTTLLSKNIGNMNRDTLLSIYGILLLFLNLWLVLNYYKKRGLSFLVLLQSLVISIVLLIVMTNIIAKNRLDSMELVWMLLPTCIWLGLASSLNAVTYDHYS